MDATNDFTLWKGHSLSKFYGLGNRFYKPRWRNLSISYFVLSVFPSKGDFVVISPGGNEMLTSESRPHLVYSSMAMAINNIQW